MGNPLMLCRCILNLWISFFASQEYVSQRSACFQMNSSPARVLKPLTRVIILKTESQRPVSKLVVLQQFTERRCSWNWYNSTWSSVGITGTMVMEWRCVGACVGLMVTSRPEPPFLIPNSSTACIRWKRFCHCAPSNGGHKFHLGETRFTDRINFGNTVLA